MLREMYSGKIIPCERHNNNTAEQQEIVARIAAEEKYFAEKLAPEDYERFMKLPDLYSELSTSCESDSFSYGFSVGMLLMADVMIEVEPILDRHKPR